MMKFELLDGLPFITITVTYKEKDLKIDRVLIDTGSASTILSIDKLISINVTPQPEDILNVIRGVGGREAVFRRKMDYIKVGEISLSSFEIEIGSMDYGFDIHGILGMDFLLKANAMIDIGNLNLEFYKPLS